MDERTDKVSALDIRFPAIGNLTADPELKFLPSGVAKVTFTIANTPRVQDRETKEWKDAPTKFFNCVAWRQLAENIAESLPRGSRVVAVLVLKVEEWTDKETGEKKSRDIYEVEELGTSLAFATAPPKKMQRSKAGVPA